MAEQTRKFGQRLRERRREVGLKHQKDLVARMVELGDKGLNTNQVSRYENGEGPLPREQRLEWFAEATETTTEDLLSGPVADRRPAQKGDLSKLDGDSEVLLREIAADVKSIIRRLDAAAASRSATAQIEGSSRRRKRSGQEPDEDRPAADEQPPDA